MHGITTEETHAVDDIAMDALVMDESSSLSWFSFRAKVGTNFEPGRESFFRWTRSLLMYNRLLVELVLHETCLLKIRMIPQYLMTLSSAFPVIH